MSAAEQWHTKVVCRLPERFRWSSATAVSSSSGVFPEYSQEVRLLLVLLDHVVGSGRPREVLCDVFAKELEDRNHLHTFPVNVVRFRVCPFPMKVHDYFLCLGSVQDEVVDLAPPHQSADLLLPPEMGQTMVVWSAYLTRVSVG